MNSTISGSEPAGAGAGGGAAWASWLHLFLLTLATATVLLFTFVVIMDPFSSGRLTPIKRIDIAIGNRIYADVGRVRDPAFDSAVFGDSTSVQIDPARLSAATGYRFAMLGIEGTWPPEHLFLMQRFERLHRGRPGVLVIVLSDLWCTADKLKPNTGVELPRWLYDGTTFEYLARILSPSALRSSYRRLLLFLGLGGEEASADGYDPTPWTPYDRDERMRAMLAMAPPVDGDDPGLPFPALDDLQKEAAGFDPAHALLMVFTPVYRQSIPVPGSVAARRLEACKARAQAIASSRATARVLDLRVDGPKAGNPDNFVDPPHYKADIARDVEASIAESVNALMPRDRPR